jgi:hypothetical protein
MSYAGCKGFPRGVLDDPAMMNALLPRLKADAVLYRNYIYSEDAQFDFPIRAYGGVDDPNVHMQHLEAWREQTTASFEVRRFPRRPLLPADECGRAPRRARIWISNEKSLFSTATASIPGDLSWDGLPQIGRHRRYSSRTPARLKWCTRACRRGCGA